MVAQHQQQVVADDRVADTADAGQGIGDDADAGIAGGRAGRHQRRAAGIDQVIAGGHQAGGDGAARDAGPAADHDAAAGRRQIKRTGSLRVIAGDGDDAVERQGGAAVGDRTPSGNDAVIQQQVAGREEQVAQRIDDRTHAGLAGQGADGARRAAGDGQVVGTLVVDPAPDHPAVAEATNAAADIDRFNAIDRATGLVDQRAQRAGHIQGVGGIADQAAVGQHRHLAAHLHGTLRRRDRAAIAQRGQRAVAIEIDALRSAIDRTGVRQQPHGAVIGKTRRAGGNVAGIGQGAEIGVVLQTRRRTANDGAADAVQHRQDGRLIAETLAGTRDPATIDHCGDGGIVGDAGPAGVVRRQGAAVGQRAQRARRCHIDAIEHVCERGGVSDRCLAVTDIVIADLHHQVGAAGRAGDGQAGDAAAAAAEDDAGIVGPGPA